MNNEASRSAAKYLRKRLKYFLERLPYRILPRKANVVYYFHGTFRRLDNFGDALCRDLMDFFGVKSVYTRLSKAANLSCIGSNLNAYVWEFPKKISVEPLRVFGSGFRDDITMPNAYFMRPMEIYALRGKLSRQLCEKLTGENLGGVPLGDPGLLVKRIWRDIQPSGRYDVGIVLHYNDKNSPLISNIRLSGHSVRYIDIQGRPRDVAEQIAECEFILSSALHGLICADAFGIPNQHIIISALSEGIKYNDYYSVFEGFNYNPVDLRKSVITDADIDFFASRYSILPGQIEAICDRLEAAFYTMIKRG